MVNPAKPPATTPWAMLPAELRLPSIWLQFPPLLCNLRVQVYPSLNQTTDTGTRCGRKTVGAASIRKIRESEWAL